MKQFIPAKTFLVGEYAALHGESAIVLTTAPCFELTITNETGLTGIHPDSPAGVCWSRYGVPHRGLQWFDPYHGLGGMGASSAQFLAVYRACQSLTTDHQRMDLLTTYYECAWDEKGTRPSGYDVLAQSKKGCVYICKNQGVLQSMPWVFSDICCLLFHTHQKLATHLHLSTMETLDSVEPLHQLVLRAKEAFARKKSTELIQVVKRYYDALLAEGLVAATTIEWVNTIKQIPQTLAVKGCGALGADIILVLTSREDKHPMIRLIEEHGLSFIASSDEIMRKNT